MNGPIYCFIFVGLPCFALAVSRSGYRTVANRDGAEDASYLMTDERNSLMKYLDGGYRSHNDVLSYRRKRQSQVNQVVLAAEPEIKRKGQPKISGNGQAKEAADPGPGANPTATTEPPSGAATEASPPGEAAGADITDIRWMTYLSLLGLSVLFLILTAIVFLLSYYILSTRVLNKTTCKEIELQCRCDDCDKDNEDC